MSLVVALMGLPRSGKTTLANFIKEEADVFFLSRDEIRSALFQPCEFNEEEKSSAYDALKIGLETNLSLDRNCVIDGMTFSKRDQVKEVSQIADRFGAKVIFFHLILPVEIAIERTKKDIINKVPTLNRNTESTVADIAERFETPPRFVIDVDATGTPEEIFSTVKQHIKSVVHNSFFNKS